MRKFKFLKIAGLLVYPALMGSVSSVISEVHPIYLSIFILSFAAGLFLDRRSHSLSIVKPSILLILVVISIIVSLIGISNTNLFNRAIGILLILISARLISPKKARDILQLYLLNFFTVAGSVVIRLDIEFGLLVLGETYISILGLMLLYGSAEQEEAEPAHILKLVRLSGLLTLALIPVTVIIFLVIPRPSMTLFAWGGGSTAATGFSDRVSPGAVEQIKSDTSPAFRVKWISGTRPREFLWRGIVYDRYNQGSWERSRTEKITTPVMPSESIEYEVVMEPTGTKYLFSTGIPYRTLPGTRMASVVTGYTLESLRNIDRRIIYKAYSYRATAIPPDLSPELYTEISEKLSEALAHLTHGLAGNTVIDTANSVKNMLADNYTYDLSPGEPKGDPVIHFLTGSKKGHCEYFASSMALLLRSMGIPARIVGGYLTGEWNSMGQYYLVRQSDAHTWVEVWDREQGWISFDPTPPASLTAGRTVRNLFYRLIDLLRYKWYYWVIDYNIDRQLDLARNTAMLFRSLRSKDIRMDLSGKIPGTRYLISLSIIIILLIGLFYVRRYLKKRPRSWSEKFIFVMEKNGYRWKQSQTLLELASTVRAVDSTVKDTAMAFVEKYHLYDYGRADKEELETILKTLNDDFTRMKLPHPQRA